MFMERMSKWINFSLPTQVGINFSPRWGSCVYHNKPPVFIVVFLIFCFLVRLYATCGQGPVCACSSTLLVPGQCLAHSRHLWIGIQCLLIWQLQYSSEVTWVPKKSISKFFPIFLLIMFYFLFLIQQKEIISHYSFTPAWFKKF